MKVLLLFFLKYLNVCKFRNITVNSKVNLNVEHEVNRESGRAKCYTRAIFMRVEYIYN